MLARRPDPVPSRHGTLIALARGSATACHCPAIRAERMRRFYAKADIAPAEGGFAVRLDGRSPRSPHGQPLVAAHRGAGRPRRRRVGGAGREHPARDHAGDAARLGRAGARRRGRAAAGRGARRRLRAVRPALLLRRRSRQPGRAPGAPLGAGDRLGRDDARRRVPPHPGRHPPAAAARDHRPDRGAGRAPSADFALAGLAAAAALFGSAILGFALRRGELDGEAAFELSRLDETFQEERWGVDAEAAARADAMAKEAVMLGRLVRGARSRPQA